MQWWEDLCFKVKITGKHFHLVLNLYTNFPTIPIHDSESRVYFISPNWPYFLEWSKSLAFSSRWQCEKVRLVLWLYNYAFTNFLDIFGHMYLIRIGPYMLVDMSTSWLPRKHEVLWGKQIIFPNLYQEKTQAMSIFIQFAWIDFVGSALVFIECVVLIILL